MLRKLDRNCRWWIKGDGTDVVKGLWESVNGEWAGDVDLNDGKLREQFQQHKEKLEWAKNIDLQRQSIEHMKEDLVDAQDKVSAEIEFISEGIYTDVEL